MSERKLKNCHTENIIIRDCHVRTRSFLAMTMILFPFSAHATCTPTPDCASIGYTETSCETISLKCPFDQTKLYCFPCDSSFQYSCSNTNEYGNGESCNGKYKSCCNTDCIVGNYYYLDKTCSSCLDNAKTMIGIVVKDYELIMETEVNYLIWSNSEVDLTNLTSIETSNEAKNDYLGFDNTANIVNYYGADKTNLAAVFCYNYAPAGLENSKGQWYLPALGEIYNYLYLNYKTIIDKYPANASSLFWSSSEFGNRLAWRVNKHNGEIATNLKTENTSDTTCFLKIN